MDEQINWEDIMKATERSASAASRNSENAVGGMVKLLERIDRHSSRMDAMTKELQTLNAIHAQCVQRNENTLNDAQGGARHSWQVRALGFSIAFVVGAMFGGFFVS